MGAFRTIPFVRIVAAEVIHLRQDQGYGAPAGGEESAGVPNVALVRLETEDGIVGWADVETAPTVARAAMDAPDQPFFRGLRNTILGANPLEVDRLWTAMYRDSVYYGKDGVAIQVMSGVINACFDIVGKAFGVPVSELLGGRNRERVRAHASTLFRETPPLMESAVRGYLAQGFTAIKFGWGVFRDDPGLDVELVAAARAAAGPDVALMVDAGWMKPSITVRNTIELCRRLAPYDITWFEDCLHPRNYEGYELLCRESPVPIAAGEQEATYSGFARLLRADLGFVQPDLSRCGGLSVARQIATVAQARQIAVVPHAWLTDLNTATALQFDAWLDDAPFLEFNVSQGPLARDLSATRSGSRTATFACPTDRASGSSPTRTRSRVTACRDSVDGDPRCRPARADGPTVRRDGRPRDAGPA
jgi:L-alanine-DL-glutamate epimerase-like enolase superfamily enzyme